MLEMPSELSGPLPRKVQLNSEGDARYLLAMVWLFFVGGLLFFGWWGYDAFKQYEHRSLLRGAVHTATGEVTGFAFGRYTPIRVYYRFSVDGVSYSGKAVEPSNLVAGTSFDKGDKILIRFLQSDPAINHPDAWEWRIYVGWYVIVGQLFFMALGCISAVFLLRERKLARWGKAAVGTVTGCMRTDKTFQIDYDFHTDTDTPVKGRNECIDEYGAGARIWILYLPQNPRRNQVYPLDFYTIL